LEISISTAFQGMAKAVKENELGGVIIHVIIVSYNHGIVLEIGKGGR
jgi:hypothetical protein